MPSKANVIIKYGPTNSNGIIDYRTDRLIGLQKYLSSKGHKIIDLKKAKNWDNVEIIVNEESIYKGSLKDLEFGGDGELDPVVIKIENLVSQGY